MKRIIIGILLLAMLVISCAPQLGWSKSYTITYIDGTKETVYGEQDIDIRPSLVLVKINGKRVYISTSAIKKISAD